MLENDLVTQLALEMKLYWDLKTKMVKDSKSSKKFKRRWIEAKKNMRLDSWKAMQTKAATGLRPPLRRGGVWLLQYEPPREPVEGELLFRITKEMFADFRAGKYHTMVVKTGASQEVPGNLVAIELGGIRGMSAVVSGGSFLQEYGYCQSEGECPKIMKDITKLGYEGYRVLRCYYSKGDAGTTTSSHFGGKRYRANCRFRKRVSAARAIRAYRRRLTPCITWAAIIITICAICIGWRSQVYKDWHSHIAPKRWRR